MRRFIDLHTHSSVSDGAMEPEELIALADRKQLAAIALTDHDTTEGLQGAGKAAEGFPELRFIPGIEISARFPSGTLHILGYGIDETCEQLQDLLSKLRAARNDRNPRIITRLQDMGIDIEMENVLRVAGLGSDAVNGAGVVSRLHIAQALVSKKQVRSVKEAFDKLIADGRPGFVEKDRLSAREAIGAIHQGGGVAVLAHPPQLNYENRAQLERILRDLIHDGIGGIEVYHSDHTPSQTRLYLDMGRKYDLCVTGGSDFHGAAKPDARIGHPRVPLSAITGQFMRKLIGEQE